MAGLLRLEASPFRATRIIDQDSIVREYRPLATASCHYGQLCVFPMYDGSFVSGHPLPYGFWSDIFLNRREKHVRISGRRW